MKLSPAAMFRTLGHPDRLAVFELIRHAGDQCAATSAAICACDIARQVGLSASMVSRHLRELRLVDLIRTERRGQWIHCTVNPEAVEAMRSFLEPEPEREARQSA